MNEQTDKIKICDIIADCFTKEENFTWNGRLVPKLANALIAAGIGDVEIVRKIGIAATKIAILEAAEAERRAARAERALEKFAENITCEDCPFSSDCASSEKMGYPIHSNNCFAEYLRQAEEALAEEGKDD